MFKLDYFRKWEQLVISKQSRNSSIISDDQEESKMKLLYRCTIRNYQERKTQRYGIKMMLLFYTILKKIESTIKVDSAILLEKSGLLKMKSFESYKL